MQGVNKAIEVESVRTPEKAAASKARRAGDLEAAAAITITPFVEAFCFEYARTGMLAESYRTAELQTLTWLDLSGYVVEREAVPQKKGPPLTITRISTPDGYYLTETEIRYAKASRLISYPEVRARVKECKEERARAVNVTAESLAAELESIRERAMFLGQTNVAHATIQTAAKLFGFDGGEGNPSDPAPATTEVRISIRDCTRKHEE